MAASEELIEQTDDALELRLAAEHHEFAPTYNDQDLSEFLFTNPTGDFEFVPLEEVAESGKTPSSHIVAARQAPDRTLKPRRRRSLWETMKEAVMYLNPCLSLELTFYTQVNGVRHDDASEEHSINSGASEQPSVRSGLNKEEKFQSPVMGGWPLMDSADEQEWCEEFYE